MWVVILTAGDDLPEAFGPFDSEEDCYTFAAGVSRDPNDWTPLQVASPIPARLEYLRGQIRAERISYYDLAELQGLAAHIDPNDVELLEWAGVPEHAEEN